MNIASLLTKTARTFAARPAISHGMDLYATYGDLFQRVEQLADTLLTRFELQVGDRIGLAMSNCPEYIEILYAVWYAGLIAVPINAKLHSNEFAYILKNSSARLCFATPELVNIIEPLVPKIGSLEALLMAGGPGYNELFTERRTEMCAVSPDTVAWLFYTSGTTGRPKGAMLTHRNLLLMTLGYYADIDSITPFDCIIHAAPMSHGSGLYGLPHVAKGANQIIPASGGFDASEFLGLLPAYEGVSCFFAPTMVTRLVNDPDVAEADTRNLKTLIYGGGPMYVEDSVQALELFGPKLVQIYGQGEAPMTITALPKAFHADVDHPLYMERLGSAGIARCDVEVRVVDEEDRDVERGDIGEVVVRGDVVMRGYWDNPEASAETLRGGWLHTGDMGAFDAEGFLTLKDRSKDMIISGGTNIYPREIEEVLLQHGDVIEVSVIGRPHRDWGEEVVAFVVCRPDTMASRDELDQLCLDTIARFKRPRDYIFVDELPKNNYGKVLKTVLREQFTGN